MSEYYQREALRRGAQSALSRPMRGGETALPWCELMRRERVESPGQQQPPHDDDGERAIPTCRQVRHVTYGRNRGRLAGIKGLCGCQIEESILISVVAEGTQ